MKYCNLCLRNEADKKNSHIFPKFIGEALITTNDGKRKGFKIDNDTVGKNQRPYQDTPKENFILCSSCEKYIGNLERKFANELYRKLSGRTNQDFFIKTIVGDHIVFYQCNKVDYYNFKLTVYSMLFRAEISTLDFFRDTHLSPAQNEKLRLILNKEIPFEDIPIIAVIPEADKKHTYNYIYSATATKTLNYLWANDIIFIISFNPNENLIQSFNDVVTTNFSSVKLLEVDDETWNEWRQGLMFLKVSLIKNEEK